MKYFSVLLVFTAFFSGCSNPQDLQLKLYKQAMDVGDLPTAITAVQTMLALDPSDSTYRDTLVMLYFQNGSYAQSAQMAANFLRNDPTNRKYLEVIARSLQAGGRLPEAAGYYQKLFDLTHDRTYQYQLAALNFNAGRLDQSLQYVDQLLKAPADTSRVKLYASDGVMQLIPLRAAVYNLQGSVYSQLKKNAEAAQSFQQALQIDSSFRIAHQNLNNITR